jgi:multiple sugar transport system substrate-binding protein
LRNKYHIAPKDVITYQEEDARHVFQEGKAVFMRNWPYAWTLAQAANSPIAGKIGVCPMPHGPMGTKGAATLGGWNLGISAFSKHKKEAVEVIKFLTSYEAEVLKSVIGGNIPTRKAVYKDPIVLRFAPYYKDLYNVFINARPRPVSPIYPEISDKIQIYVHKVLAQEMTAKAAMEELQKQLENVLANY